MTTLARVRPGGLQSDRTARSDRRSAVIQRVRAYGAVTTRVIIPWPPLRAANWCWERVRLRRPPGVIDGFVAVAFDRVALLIVVFRSAAPEDPRPNALFRGRPTGSHDGRLSRFHGCDLRIARLLPVGPNYHARPCRRGSKAPLASQNAAAQSSDSPPDAWCGCTTIRASTRWCREALKANRTLAAADANFAAGASAVRRSCQSLPHDSGFRTRHLRTHALTMRSRDRRPSARNRLAVRRHPQSRYESICSVACTGPSRSPMPMRTRLPRRRQRQSGGGRETRRRMPHCALGEELAWRVIRSTWSPTRRRSSGVAMTRGPIRYSTSRGLRLWSPRSMRPFPAGRPAPCRSFALTAELGGRRRTHPRNSRLLVAAAFGRRHSVGDGAALIKRRPDVRQAGGAWRPQRLKSAWRPRICIPASAHRTLRGGCHALSELHQTSAAPGALVLYQLELPQYGGASSPRPSAKAQQAAALASFDSVVLTR